MGTRRRRRRGHFEGGRGEETEDSVGAEQGRLGAAERGIWRGVWREEASGRGRR